jgi:hypothetical protein
LSYLPLFKTAALIISPDLPTTPVVASSGRFAGNQWKRINFPLLPNGAGVHKINSEDVR